MTPEERRELAERLDRAAALNERTAKVMGGLGRGWANAAADLRAAAAALREMMPSTEEIVTAARASLWEEMESAAVEKLTAERDAAQAEVARLRAKEDIEHPVVLPAQPREHARVLRGTVRRVGLTPEQLLSEGFRVVPADAVVIPRSAIPDELVERLWLLDGFLSEDPNWDGSALRRYLRIAARLLSGATTEGDER